MEFYTFKFSACLFAFYVVYVLLLEKQKNHHFKRFYLLGALITSICIPLITVTSYINSPVNKLDSQAGFLLAEQSDQMTQIEQISTWELADILWTIYAIGALLFLIRFVINLRQVYKDVTSHDTAPKRAFVYVLLDHYKIPHTFFNFIFLHKKSYEEDMIPQEVLLHEETHAKQLHSADIIMIELIQIVFWFHPLIYIIKQHVKLNHEFLADNAVLKQGVSTKNYQHILLQYSSNSNNHQLASAINYSSFKKRFTVMKTQTSKTRIWLSSLVLIPLVALLLVSFTTKKEIVVDNSDLSSGQQLNSNPSFLEYIIDMEKQGASFYLDNVLISVEDAKTIAKNNKGKRTDMITQKDTNGKYMVKLSSPTASNEYARSIDLKVFNDNTYSVDGIMATKRTFIDVFNQLHQDISSETRNKLMNINVSSSQTLSNKETWFIYNSLLDYGFHRIVTSNQEIIRSKGNTPFAIENQSSNRNQQNIPTAKEVANYNNWAKKINASLNKAKSDNTYEYPIIKQKSITKYKEIYNRMTAQQKKNSEAFPKFPPPPPPPPPPIHKGKVNEKLLIYYNTWRKGLQNEDGSYKMITSDEQRYYSSIYDNMTSDQKKRAVGVPPPPPPPKPKVIEVKEVPPPPPPPQKPLDYVKSMAKTNTVFYYEGKRITSKEAIKIVTQNQSITIKSKKTDAGIPEVYLSKAPVIKEVRRN